jgi:ABC-type transport system involved in multi-copper enzyme maturation permease subunit
MWPVIFRELRAESRKSFTYWLRVIGAAAILAAIFFTLQQPGRWTRFGALPVVQSQQLMGRMLFGNVNGTLFALVWLIVPLLTADCINREKREGTLGLLFLTPLTAEGIVIGKMFAHALRALTFVLTMLPVLAVPLLVGGIDQKDLFMALLLDLSALLLALTAGLLASSWTRRWMTALLLAETLAFLFAVILMRAHLVCFQSLVGSAAQLPTGQFSAFAPGGVSGWTSYGSFQIQQSYRSGFLDSLVHLFHFNTSTDLEMGLRWTPRGSPIRFVVGGTWSQVWTSGNAALIHQWFWAALSLLGGACLFFGLAISLAAWGIRRSWRLQAQTARAVQLEQKFLQPRFWPALFRKKMQRSMERNPIGWLQQYSVRARLTKWGWCLFVVIVECLFTGSFARASRDAILNDVTFGQVFVFAVLLLAMTFTAAGSFRHERETGALELLLVTPLRVWQIVVGRIGGIWRQFLPATALALGAALYVSTFDGFLFDQSDLVEMTADFSLLLSSFVAVPLTGLYWSMRRANFLVAWIGAFTSSLVMPGCVTWAFMRVVHDHQQNASWGLVIFVGVQLGVAAISAARLFANLSARRFVITT